MLVHPRVNWFSSLRYAAPKPFSVVKNSAARRQCRTSEPRLRSQRDFRLGGGGGGPEKTPRPAFREQWQNIMTNN